MGEMIAAIIVAVLIWNCIWGSVTALVIENRGYNENWFWWGFFFGFLALIVACTKPQITATQQDENSENQESTVTEKESAELINLKILREYKELLDSGVITQEDFDKKKAEILG